MARVVYTGSMTQRSPFFPNADGEGIVIWRWEDGAKELTRVGTVTDIPNPSWLALDVQNQRLYATSEMHETTDGRVGAFAIDPVTGGLKLISGQECAGSATCHLAVSSDGQFQAWANYGTLPLGTTKDASIVLCQSSSSHPCRVGIHGGKTPATSGRQERRHAHFVLFDEPNNRVISTDLGLDALFSMPLDTEDDAPPEMLFVFPPGSGPRHIAMHPNGVTYLVVHELLPRIDVLQARDKSFELCQSVRIGMRDVAQPAGLVLSPDGRHVYVSIRGTNEIRAFAISEDGQIGTKPIIVSTGRTPRDLSFTEDGAILMVACQDDGDIRAYQRDPQTGDLDNGTIIARTGSPTCVTSYETNKE